MVLGLEVPDQRRKGEKSVRIGQQQQRNCRKQERRRRNVEFHARIDNRMFISYHYSIVVKYKKNP
jgi:hypothetical protein